MRIILIQPIESDAIVQGVKMAHKCVDQDLLVAFQVSRTNNQAHASLTLHMYRRPNDIHALEHHAAYVLCHSSNIMRFHRAVP
jgi:hypothetical protein